MRQESLYVLTTRIDLINQSSIFARPWRQGGSVGFLMVRHMFVGIEAEATMNRLPGVEHGPRMVDAL